MTVLQNKLTAGDTWDWSVSASDYLSTAGWTLTLYLVPRFATPTQAPITLAASGNADGSHRFTRTAAQSAAYQPGVYGFSTRASKGAEVYTLDGTAWSGEVTVWADPSTLAQGADTRTQDQTALDAIDAVLANRATTDQKSYSIAGRALERMTVDELLALRRYYAARVQKSKGLTGRIYLRA